MSGVVVPQYRRFPGEHKCCTVIIQKCKFFNRICICKESMFFSYTSCMYEKQRQTYIPKTMRDTVSVAC